MSDAAERVTLDYAPPEPDWAQRTIRRLQHWLNHSGYPLVIVGGIYLMAFDGRTSTADAIVWMTAWWIFGTFHLVLPVRQFIRTTRGRPIRRTIDLSTVVFVWFATSIAWQSTPTHLWVVIKPIPQVIVIRGYVGPSASPSTVAGCLVGRPAGYWDRAQDFGTPLLP